MYSIGIDFGSNAVRVLMIDLSEYKVVASASQDYQLADKGVFTDKTDSNLARQDANDYLKSMTLAMEHLRNDKSLHDFDWTLVKGIGVDATGSTPMPVTQDMKPVSELSEFTNNLNAKAWMWKDHTSETEANQITELAAKIRPEFLKSCGGKYSSEWFWAKAMHCLQVDKAAFDAAYTWVEFSDYIPAVLTGVGHAGDIKRNLCAAGHKGLYAEKWGGYPDIEFLGELHPDLVRLRESLPEKLYAVDQIAGNLSKEWTSKFGLTENVIVAIGALDAHVGAIGSGVNEDSLVKIMGTSSCDIMVGDLSIDDIPGVAGVAAHSVLPGFIGIEAGQSAVGDLFKWFVVELLGKDESYHGPLVENASKLKPGESGLLALDWNNGNRNVLTDPNLRGMILGQSLHTKDFEIYRALLEASVFGSKRIIDQLEMNGISIKKLVCCGGIPQKNPLIMQIFADVLNRPIYMSENIETVALGAALIGGLIVLQDQNQEIKLTDLQDRYCELSSLVYHPKSEQAEIYKDIYQLYLNVHDAFGKEDSKMDLFPLMKQLIQIKTQVSNS